MLQGFKEFVLRGNIVELAVAVVIGTAFAALVAAFTDNIINPVLAAVGGGGDIPGWGAYLIEGQDSTFVNLGAVLAALLQFLLTAAVVYFVFVLPMNRVAALARRGELPVEEGPTPELEVLGEIRDLLRAQQSQRPL
jgi:large conductance mechanosensitive channel